MKCNPFYKLSVCIFTFFIFVGTAGISTASVQAVINIDTSQATGPVNRAIFGGGGGWYEHFGYASNYQCRGDFPNLPCPYDKSEFIQKDGQFLQELGMWGLRLANSGGSTGTPSTDHLDDMMEVIAASGTQGAPFVINVGHTEFYKRNLDAIRNLAQHIMDNGYPLHYWKMSQEDYYFQNFDSIVGNWYIESIPGSSKYSNDKNGLTQWYGETAALFANMLREVDPEAKIIITPMGRFGFGPGEDGREALDKLELETYALYATSEGLDALGGWSNHPTITAAHPNYTNGRPEEEYNAVFFEIAIYEQHYAHTSDWSQEVQGIGKRLPQAITAWWIYGPTTGAGGQGVDRGYLSSLATAWWKIGALNNPDFLLWQCEYSSVSNPVWNPDGNFGDRTPQVLITQHLLDLALTADVQTPTFTVDHYNWQASNTHGPQDLPALRVFASKNYAGNTVTVVVANADPYEDITTTINLDSFTPQNYAQIQTMNILHPNASIAEIVNAYTQNYNASASSHFGITSSQELLSDGSLTYDFPAHSLTAITFVGESGPDTAPPFTTDHDPAKGATNAPYSRPLKFHIKDYGSGVDESSIVLTVNGQEVTPAITGNQYDYLVTYAPAEGFVPDSEVSISIDASDQDGNIMSTETYAVSFASASQEDTVPPYTSEHQPAKGATGVSRYTNIVLSVNDSDSGVDQSSIVMTVEGNVVSPVISGSSGKYSLTYNPGSAFNPGQVVNVTIQASDTAGNAMSKESYNFTVDSSSVPGVPVLSSPDNDSTIQGTSVTLQWGAVSSATRYRVVYRVIGGTWTAHYESGTSNTINGLAVGLTYEWKVRAENTSGSSAIAGDYSSPWQFTVAGSSSSLNDPTLSSPSNGATLQGTSVTLKWNAVSSATRYRVVYRVIGGTWTAHYEGGTSITINGLAGGLTYEWKVRAENTSGSSTIAGDYSSPWQFTVAGGSSSLNNLTLFSPSHGATVQGTSVTLEWNTVSSATRYRVVYRVIGGSWTAHYESDTSITINGLAGGLTYEWKVRAENTSGSSTIAGAYSSPWQFTVAGGSDSLIAPSLSSPDDGAAGLDNKVMLQWNPVDGGTRYRVAYRIPGDSWSIVYASGTSTTLNGLLDGQMYEWKVRAENTASQPTQTSDYSPCWTFSLSIPDSLAIPILSSPSNGSAETGTSVTLQWEPVTYATRYRLAYRRLGNSWSIAYVYDTTSRTLTGLLENQTYEWKVRAENTSGSSTVISDYSEDWTFTMSYEVIATTAESSDDGTNFGSGSPNLTQANLRLGAQGGGGYQCGLRFPNVNLPSGAVIESASISLSPFSSGYCDLNLLIRGISQDNAPEFTTEDNWETRPLTAALAYWDISSAVETTDLIGGPGEIASNDVTAVIEEIVNSHGWESGNAIAIRIENNGSPFYYDFKSMEHWGSPKGARLIIRYSLN